MQAIVCKLVLKKEGLAGQHWDESPALVWRDSKVREWAMHFSASESRDRTMKREQQMLHLKLFGNFRWEFLFQQAAVDSRDRRQLLVKVCRTFQQWVDCDSEKFFQFQARTANYVSMSPLLPPFFDCRLRVAVGRNREPPESNLSYQVLITKTKVVIHFIIATLVM